MPASGAVPQQRPASEKALEDMSSAQRRLLLSLCCAQLVLVLDATVVNLALMPLAADLGIGAATLAWVINGYAITQGGLLLVGGRVADLFGRRSVFLVGASAFAAACALAAAAWSAQVLIIARLLQGVAAALLGPASTGLLVLGFPDGPLRHRALSAWAAVSAVGGTAGVVLSGTISQLVSWRAMFGVNVALVTLVVLVGRRVLPRTAVLPEAKLNVTGSALATGSLFALVYCLQTAGEGPVRLWLLLAVLVLAFIVSERRSSAPLVLHPPRRPWRRDQVESIFINAVTGAVFGGSLFLLLLTLQGEWGWGSSRTGAALVPIGAGLLAGSRLAPVLLSRLSAARLMHAAFAVATSGLLALGAATELRSVSVLLVGMMLMALGHGILVLVVTTEALADACDQDASQTGALLAVTQQVGGAVGVAAVAAAHDRASAGAAFLVAALVVTLTAAATAASTRSRRRPDHRGEHQEPDGAVHR